MRCLVGDLNGRVLAELSPLVQSVSEVMNGVGLAKMTFSRADEKVTADTLRFGNRLFVAFDNGLKWGGFIDPPRRWTTDSISITAYSGEGLLGWRTTDKGRYFSGNTKGEIFRAILSEMRPIAGFNIGQVWEGGVTHSPDYHLENVLDLVRASLCSRLGVAEFAVIPDVVNGYITFKAELYERRGIDTNMLLVEGGNVVGAEELNEQGPVINDWTIAGADIAGGGEDGWGDSRLTASAEDVTSIGLYGRRQGSEIYNDISETETLISKVDALRDEHGRPKNLFSIDAIDTDPARFTDYNVGDSILLQLPSFGFGGTNTRVRVLAREYFPQAGTLNLVVQEVLS